MRHIKKLMLIFLVLINMFTTTGCWNYREAEKMDLVIGVAIDKDKTNNKYILTIEVIEPSVSEKQSKFTSVLYTTSGDTIFDAVRDMILKGGRKAYWGHASVVVISRDIVEEDINPVVDWMYRDQETRGNLYILVSKKETAKEIFELGHKSDEIKSDQLTYGLKNQKSIPKYPKTELSKVVENFASKDSVVLLTLVDAKSENNKIEPEMSGSAILKYDKVIGYLTPDETQYALWGRNDVKGGVIVVKNIIGSGCNITFEIFSAKTKLKPEYLNNEIIMNMDVKFQVDIGEISGNLNFQNENIKEEIKKDAEAQIKSQFENIIKKVQINYHSDIFRFGSKIEIDNPKVWKKIKPDWDDKFTSLPVQVNVDLIIKGSALMSKPVKGGNN